TRTRFRLLRVLAMMTCHRMVSQTVKKAYTCETQLRLAVMSSSKEDFERLFNLSLDMLCIAGFDGYFKRLNPVWEQALGFTIEELMSKPYLDFVQPDDRAATIAAAARVESGRSEARFPNRYLAKDGTYRWLSWNAVPYPAEQVIYAFARDVTEIRKNSARRA